MKKVLLALSVIATVACFSSCTKKCDCKVFVAGVSTENEYTIDELNKSFGTDYKKCKDFNNVVEIAGVKAGTDCSGTF